MFTRLFLFFPMLLILLSTEVFSFDQSQIEEMVRDSKARADIVEIAEKAVVHIKVEKIVKGSNGSQGYNNPYDLFNDQFFEQFFPGLRGRRSFPNQPREYKQEGAGSGSIISKKGYILTNNHVVGGADKITVHLRDGREFEGELIGTDPLTDIAVIKIKAKGLTIISTGNSDDIRTGETVIAIGNPFGLSHTVTMGIVSAKGRSNVDIVDYEDFIQTDAAINPGNSGGPLIDLEGKIIGVNTAIYTKSGGYQGIGFAVPINMAQKVMKQLIEKGSVSRGWLGVMLQDISPDLAKALNLKNTSGTIIAEVTEDSPAVQGGLRRGDVVIRFEDKNIKNADHLKNEVGLSSPESVVKMIVLRDGKEKQLKVKLGSRPTDNKLSYNSPKIDKTLGMRVQDLSPQLAKHFGYNEATRGVIITEISQESPAFRAGLKPGLLVLEINRQKVPDVRTFENLIRKINLKNGILLLIASPKGAQYLVLK
jgi:serine protease Do